MHFMDPGFFVVNGFNISSRKSSFENDTWTVHGFLSVTNNFHSIDPDAANSCRVLVRAFKGGVVLDL